ncbi:Endonuclease/exonuclease/phosphatase [Phyllosticta capitalensis]|uniref:Endonuclease/exonuclease/phosphatase n=1 Tax=Phyllosticta capitalensis TaxID=121624 RepID=A0ABR1YGD9_9PEZI
MDRDSGTESTDGSSIKPVSSLRSHFEKMLNDKSAPDNNSDPKPPRMSRPSLGNIFEKADEPRSRNDGRISLDLPRPNANSLRSTSPKGIYAPQRTPETRAVDTRSSSQRPISMYQLSPQSSPPRSPTRTPPLVTVNSPGSPTRLVDSQVSSPTFRVSPQPTSASASQSGSPPGNGLRNFPVQSRATTPAIEARQVPFLQASSRPAPSPDPIKPPSVVPDRDLGGRSPSVASSSGIPPPINRAGKPKLPTKPASFSSSGVARASLVPEGGNVSAEERISPFSTPPSSDDSGLRSPSPPTSHPQVAHAISTSAPGPKRDTFLHQPPSVRQRAEYSLKATSSDFGSLSNRSDAHISAGEGSDSQSERPGLPPRRGGDIRRSKPPPPEPPPARRSMDTSRTSSAFDNHRSSSVNAPPRRTLTVGSASSSPAPNGQHAVVQKQQIPMTGSKQIQSQRFSALYSNDSDEADGAAEKPALTLTEYPDPSQANRRPPVFRQRPREIEIGYDTKLFAVCGEIVCTAGFLTRAWNLVTGELLLNTSLGENSKMTAVCFRPSTDVDKEGSMVWLGNEKGELFELDIPTGAVVAEKRNAHSSKIIKIYRYAAEMWTLDEDGKVAIWPPDESGSPTLQQTPSSYRVSKNQTCSIVVGNKLWVATGKDIRVFERNPDYAGFSQVLSQPLNNSNAGEVTSAAMIPGQPDRVYFGHNDGKVTVYSRKDYSCFGTINVSVYKISCLAGAGDHLWAGYNTGMIYVYDTTTTPWKVKKDWHAHQNTIFGIITDRTSLWKMDRLQVVSLGTDSVVRLWDGLMKDDWIESDMQEHDVDFCEFREIKATVMTWNAGASKPTSLKINQQDGNFFRQLLTPEDPSDIYVFGFQELVDLEDKKVTAKSFFKSAKKKDASEQEHMSRQYRAWRDHLTRCIDDYLPGEQYTLLHTANLVGLFTCIYVKESERLRIRDINAAEIKLGMHGLHGNKGALIVRFLLDDSSLCFINCHLAAGQTQTAHRNNDAAAIIQTPSLPPQMDPEERAYNFMPGGDGSMILDHEICILNGDLNYRIDTMTRDAVIKCINEGNLTRLLERDQLLLSKRRHPGFRLRPFNEYPIEFAPTYKYDVGTDSYDTSEKKRSPAWCDRLLYRGVGRIKQTEYRRHEVRVSDHRPVSGRFKIRIKTVVERRRLKVREESELRFDATKQRIATDIKLDYLVNVFGLSNKDALKLLKL